jgi:NADPH-dependent glutamate synthase beta subunit-like oxidoreductase
LARGSPSSAAATPAIDCAREALRQGAEEVTMITVEGNTSEMPAVPEDLHDMVEEGVELMHGLAVTAMLGNGKGRGAAAAPGSIHGRRSTRRRSPWTRTRRRQSFAVDNVIIAVGQHAALKWLPDQFKTERGTIKIDRFGRLGDTKFFAAGDVVQLGSGQPLMVVNAVGDGKRVAVQSRQGRRATSRCRSAWSRSTSSRISRG